MIECNPSLFTQFSLLPTAIITDLMVDCFFLVKAQWVLLFRKTFSGHLKMRLTPTNSLFFIFGPFQRLRNCIDAGDVMIG